MVEFAIILPVLILMLVGIYDFGRAIYAYNTINNAAREAGRLAIVDQTVADIQQRGASHASSLAVAPVDVYVDFRKASTPDTEASCEDEDGVSYVGTPGAVGCLAVVRVPYSYIAATPIIGNIVGTLLLQGETRFRVEFSCVDGGGVDCPLGD